MIGAPLPGGRDLSHHRHLDIGQSIGHTTLWCKPRQNPRGALIIHNATRAVDWIDDALEQGFRDFRARGKSQLGSVFEAFHHNLDRPLRRPLRGQPVDYGSLGHPIDRVDRIGSRLFRNRCQRLGGAGRTLRKNGLQNRRLHLADQFTDRLLVLHPLNRGRGLWLSQEAWNPDAGLRFRFTVGNGSTLQRARCHFKHGVRRPPKGSRIRRSAPLGAGRVPAAVAVCVPTVDLMAPQSASSRHETLTWASGDQNSTLP